MRCTVFKTHWFIYKTSYYRQAFAISSSCNANINRRYRMPSKCKQFHGFSNSSVIYSEQTIAMNILWDCVNNVAFGILFFIEPEPVQELEAIPKLPWQVLTKMWASTQRPTSKPTGVIQCYLKILCAICLSIMNCLYKFKNNWKF